MIRVTNHHISSDVAEFPNAAQSVKNSSEIREKSFMTRPIALPRTNMCTSWDLRPLQHSHVCPMQL